METQEIKTAIDGLNRDWNEMKATLLGQGADQLKKFGEHSSDVKEKLEKIGLRMDELEVKLSRPGQGERKDGKVEASDKMKAFGSYLRKSQIGPEEVKLLTVSDDTGGGFGAPDEFSTDIIKGVIDISPMRGLVSVRNTSQRSAKVMKRTGTFAAVWVGETQTRTETTGLAYGLEEIATHELYAMADISVQDLEDTAFDLEGELRMEFAEQFALAEATAVISGSGVKKPEGLLTNAAISSDNSGDADEVTYAGFINVSHNIKAGYLPNCKFILNLNTLGKARQLVSGTGELLWAPMAAGAPSTIAGFPYVLVQGLDNQSAGAYPVIFGDFQKAYRLVDRVTMSVLKDNVTQATSGAVRFIARKRLGGQVIVAEAVRKMKCSV